MPKTTLLFLILFSQNLFCQTPALVYGPFLQQASQTSIIVCWRTNTVTSTVVKYGLSKFNLNLSAQINNSVNHHAQTIQGLTANTKYYYAVSNIGNDFISDTAYFYTAPALNSKQKIRIVATGDCGTGSPQQQKVKGALTNFIKNNYVNCWLLLGDNAYYDGLDNEYTNLFFTPYQSNFIMHTSCLYPCIGNHDYAMNATLAENKNVPYYNIFYLPTLGQLGGTPSGTEAYYSYNYGNTHFISIDSYGTEQSLHVYDTISPQYAWLKQDLQQNNLMWTIVYFHHPPYTMGNHNSDTEWELQNVRKYLTPLFEKNKVDLVLNGHSHNLERSWLIKGHQGLETSFNKVVHAKDSSSARYDGTLNSCPYIKDTISNKGIVYAVCGSSGKVTGTQAAFPYDAMYYSNAQQAIGAYIEVDDNRLNAFFIGEDSVVYDKFTMFKNIKQTKTINAVIGQSFTLSASWPGNYAWSFNNLKTRQNTYTVNTNTTITVTDSLNCFSDTIKISLSNGLHAHKTNDVKLFPNPIYDNTLNLSFKEPLVIKELFLVDINGKQLKIQNFEFTANELKLHLPQVAPGNYIIRIKTSEKTINEKVIISD